MARTAAPAASATVTNDNTSFAFDDDQGNNSDTVIIEQIKQLAGQFKVFNFGVDTYHTYFIGDGIYVLVHNNAWDVGSYDAIPQNKDRTSGPEYEIHHLFSAKAGKDAGFLDRGLLGGVDFRLTSIALPTKMHKFTGSNAAGKPEYAGAYQAVEQYLLSEAKSSKSWAIERLFDLAFTDLGQANSRYGKWGAGTAHEALTQSRFKELMGSLMDKHNELSAGTDMAIVDGDMRIRIMGRAGLYYGHVEQIKKEDLETYRRPPGRCTRSGHGY